jgi:multiple sugar transport system substrate-binding protein
MEPLAARRKLFRIAVRKFGPFVSAIRKQWEIFDAAEHTGLQLDAPELDLHPLTESLFERDGLRNGEWDVAFINTDWVAACHEKRAVADLARLLAADPPEGYPEAWTPSLLRLQEIDGAVLGLPYHDGPECLIYRKDLLEDPAERLAYQAKYGAPPGLPQTWREFRQLAHHFTRPEKGLYGTAYAAYPDGHNTVYDFCLQLWTRGGELTDSRGNLRLDTPQAIDALEFYRLMLEDGAAVHPGSREMDSVKTGHAFAAGEVALMVNWFGFAAMAETLAESGVKGRVGVAEIPHAEGCTGTSLNIYWILAIAAGSPHRDVAWRFLRHCASGAMDKLLTLEGAIGCRKSTWMDEEVNRAIPFYRQMEGLHAHAREMPRRADWPRIGEVIDRMVMETIDSREDITAIVQRAQRAVMA